MTSHARFLELAAVAIDFRLSPVERSGLEAHLASCHACARSAAAIRGDALALEHLPPVVLPERRAGEILAAAMHPTVVRHPLRLVLVAALLALLAIGSVVAGAGLLRQSQDDDLSVVPPVPTATPGLLATETPGPLPSASLLPSMPPVTGPVVAPASLPLPPGSVSFAPPAAGGVGFVTLAPAPTGAVWVLVNDPPNRASESGRAVLALLTADGEPAAGWPQEIQDVVCSIRTDIPASPFSQLPLVAPDGSVRLLCRTTSPDAAPAVFALSFDASGAASAGWPVLLPADPVDARMVGDTLVLAVSEVTTDAEGEPLDTEYSILRISAAGQLEQGQVAVARHSTYDPSLAADGVAFQRWVSDFGTDPATEILAFGFDGALPGWPVSVPGIVSAVVAGPDGRYYATASARASDVAALTASQTLVSLTPSGTLSVGLDLPVAGISEATFAGGYAPIRPELESDGSAWLLGVDSRDNVVVHALGSDGTVRDGWPWEAGSPIAEQGKCDGSTGCGVWRTVPALGPGEVLLVLLAPADAKSGGQVVAVGPDGRVVDGWPVTLTNPDGRWDVVVVGADGTVYATAFEPAGAGSAITLLAIRPDSEVAWRSTLVGE
jgi:hypothetical protein